MLRDQGTIIIKRPMEEVFAALSRQRSSSAWLRLDAPGQAAQEPLRAGSRLEYPGRGFWRGRTVLEVTEYAPEQALTLRHRVAGCLGARGRSSYALEPAAGGTSVTLTLEMEGAGLLRGALPLARPLFAASLRRALVETLLALKGRLEG